MIGLVDSLPGSLIRRILEFLSEEGDGRTLGKASCVCSSWKREAKDDLWKIALMSAEDGSQRKLFVADSLYHENYRDPIVQFTAAHRPIYQRPFRESFFSVEGAHKPAASYILHFAAAIASGAVDQVVLTPKAYFANVVNVNCDSTADEKIAAVQKVRTINHYFNAVPLLTLISDG